MTPQQVNRNKYLRIDPDTGALQISDTPFDTPHVPVYVPEPEAYEPPMYQRARILLHQAYGAMFDWHFVHGDSPMLRNDEEAAMIEVCKEIQAYGFDKNPELDQPDPFETPESLIAEAEQCEADASQAVENRDWYSADAWHDQANALRIRARNLNRATTEHGTYDHARPS